MNSTDQLLSIHNRLRATHNHKKSGGEYFKREVSIISSPTSACMAQSSRGALETWSESSALLVVFCSTAETPGPRSSLANCCAPPRALCAIKGNCANGVRRHGNTSLLLWTGVNMCAGQTSRTTTATFPHQQEDCESHIQHGHTAFHIKDLCETTSE